MDDTADRLDALTRRVARLEDELAIHRLIVRYGLAVDAGDAEQASATFAPEGTYDVDVGLMDGREAIAAMVRGARHQAIVGRCAHQIGPAEVDVDGDHAVATGYSRVYLRDEAGIRIHRVSLNRWELERRNETWLITRRTTRLLGHTEATALLERALAAQRAGSSIP